MRPFGSSRGGPIGLPFTPQLLGEGDRMKDALDVHRSLLAREVPHEVIRLPRVVLSADESPDALGLPAESCVPVRVYRADDQIVAVIVRAAAPPPPGAVLASPGARTLRQSRADEVPGLTDFAAP